MHTVKEFKVSGKQSLSLWISQISKIYKELVQLSSKKKKKKKGNPMFKMGKKFE